MVTAFVLVIITIICSSLCYSQAKKKGANKALWVAMGATIGPFALLLLWFVKPSTPVT